MLRFKEFWYVLGLSLIALTLTALQGNVPIVRLLIFIPLGGIFMILFMYLVVLSIVLTTDK